MKKGVIETEESPEERKYRLETMYYREGYDARDSKKIRMENPYSKESGAFQEWDWGWIACFVVDKLTKV